VSCGQPVIVGNSTQCLKVQVAPQGVRWQVEQGGDLTLDLTGLTFMDSSGIQVIIRTARRLEGSGNLRLLRPGAVVAHTLERVRLGQLANVEMILDDDQSLETA